MATAPTLPEHRFHALAPAEVPWAELEARPDSTIFQTERWFAFLAEARGVEPVVASVSRAGEAIGWFTAGSRRRVGVGLLGSPLRGWTTSQQGFVLAPGRATGELLDDPRERAGLLRGLGRFARSTGHRHVELLDARFSAGDPAVAMAGWTSTAFRGLAVDLQPPPEGILAAMSPHGRRDVRRSQRTGVTVGPGDRASFAATYVAHLAEVFARQGRRPPYGRRLVDALVDHLEPADVVLAVARDGEGRAVASGIFPGSSTGAWFWGGASRTDARPSLPNEAMIWYALTEWHRRGARSLDLGGGPTSGFKAKFGGEAVDLAWARTSDPPALEHGRRVVIRTVDATRRARARARASIPGRS